jgi:hypothetical protein
MFSDMFEALVQCVITSFLAGGVVMFTRSLTPLKRHGVRVNVLCPEVLNEFHDGNYYYYFLLSTVFAHCNSLAMFCVLIL